MWVWCLVRKISWWRTWQPSSVLLPENPMDREAWGTTIRGGHERVGHNWVTKQQQVGKILMYRGSWSQGKWFSVDMSFRHRSVARYFYLQVFGHMCSMGFTSGLKLALHLFTEGNNYLRRWGFLDIIYVIAKSNVAVQITFKPREQVILLIAHNPALHKIHTNIFRSSEYPDQIVLYLLLRSVQSFLISFFQKIQGDRYTYS